MIKILKIERSETNKESLTDGQIWTVEVLGDKREDILVLKDVFDDHAKCTGLHCKGIKFNETYPSYGLGAKLIIETFLRVLPKEEIRISILRTLNRIIL